MLAKRLCNNREKVLAKTAPESMDDLGRNHWTNWTGIGGLFAPESVDGFNRNGWTDLPRNRWTNWTGICSLPHEPLVWLG